MFHVHIQFLYPKLTAKWHKMVVAYLDQPSESVKRVFQRLFQLLRLPRLLLLILRPEDVDELVEDVDPQRRHELVAQRLVEGILARETGLASDEASDRQ